MNRFTTAVIGLCACASLGLGRPPAPLEFGPGKIHPALLARFDAGATRVHAWVFLRDKGLAGPALDRALADLETTYADRALARRRLRRTDPGLVDARDLPVHPAYLDAVRASGAAVRVESRWLNAVSVSAGPEQLASLALLPFVASIEPVRAGRSVAPIDPAPLPPEPYAPRDFYGRSSAQLAQINLPSLHAAGFTGQGVILGILDTGFRHDHAAFNEPSHPLQIVAEHDFIFNDPVTSNEPDDDPGQQHHGTLILGCIASYLPNELVGGAYDVSVVLCKTEDIRSETPVEEDNYVAGLEFAEAHGADLTTSSLGYIDWYTQADLNGVTAVTSIAVNTASANGVHFCTAAGNEGHDADPGTSHLIAPADALRVLTCGAADLDGVIAGFSSDGPSADGRVKPELLARGSGTRTVWYDDTTSYASASGTSLSTPLLASVVACLVQAHPDWSVSKMRAALFSTASDQLANGVPDPLFVRGYGVVNAFAAANPPCQPDFTLDGNADQDDVAYLINAVGGGGNPNDADLDFNNDGNADQDDISALINTIGGAPCP